MFAAKEIDFSKYAEGCAMHEATGAGRGYAVAGGVASAIEQCVKAYYPGVDVKIEHAEGLDACKKVLILAKLGKKNPTVEKEYEAVNVTFGGDKGRPVIEYQGAIYLYQYPSKAIDDAGRKWSNDDRRWLYPLPTNELVLNPNLVQNPNW